MIPNYRAEVRALLRANPDGLSTMTIARMLEKNDRAVFKVLKVMPDVYIDRWAEKNRQYTAIWCIIRVPEDCPHPIRGKKVQPKVETKGERR
mgnify:CR=1 FL=1